MPRHAIHRMLNFDLALLGYNRRQVDRHIDKLHRRMSDAMVTFDSAIALQKELNATKEEVDQLRKVATNYQSHSRLGEQITEILMLAEEQAAAIRAEAEDEAKTIRAEAEEQARSINAATEPAAAGSTTPDGAPADGAPADGAPADGAPSDGAPSESATGSGADSGRGRAGDRSGKRWRKVSTA
jgi:hypothetical protein